MTDGTDPHDPEPTMPDREPPPSATEVVLPARPEFLALAREAARLVAREQGGTDEVLRDLTLAVDEIAAVLIEQAPSDASLRISFESDGQDLYVRIHAPSPETGFVPQTPELTVLLLQATTESFDVRRFDDGVVGVLQLRLAGA